MRPGVVNRFPPPEIQNEISWSQLKCLVCQRNIRFKFLINRQDHIWKKDPKNSRLSPVSSSTGEWCLGWSRGSHRINAQPRVSTTVLCNFPVQREQKVPCKESKQKVQREIKNWQNYLIRNKRIIINKNVSRLIFKTHRNLRLFYWIDLAISLMLVTSFRNIWRCRLDYNEGHLRPRRQVFVYLQWIIQANCFYIVST